MLRNEIFGPAIAFKFVEGNNDCKSFFEEALVVANEHLFGSLSCSVVASPDSVEQMGGANLFDAAISRLKWGTVAVNAFAGMA